MVGVIDAAEPCVIKGQWRAIEDLESGREYSMVFPRKGRWSSA